MHIAEIMTADMANGLGMRVSLFVSGCTNRCKGCFQPETWDFNYGVEWSEKYEEFLMKELSNSYYDGLTILGGEPFEPENQREIVKLLRRVKKELPEKNIWMYTGFLLDQDLISGGRKHCEVTDEILSMTDMLVDGPFVEELKQLGLRFRGSKNQRIIDMNRTREEGKVVIWERADTRD